MKLYHFTEIKFLKEEGTILKEGLKSSTQYPAADDPPPHGVVWFTSESDPVWWWDDGRMNDCRITAIIPSTDKRLIRYEKWLRKHRPDFIPGIKDEASKMG